jgi:hypothetical protein
VPLGEPAPQHPEHHKDRDEPQGDDGRLCAEVVQVSHGGAREGAMGVRTQRIAVSSQRELVALELVSRVEWFLELWGDAAEVGSCKWEDIEAMRAATQRLRALFEPLTVLVLQSEHPAGNG